MFLLFDFIVLMDLTLIEHEDYFIPLQTKFWRYTVVRGGRSYPESLCFSIHFVCLKGDNSVCYVVKEDTSLYYVVI